MTKTAADAEREVETSRSNLDRTVEALKDKMTPGQIFDEASRAMGATGQQVFAKFMEQAKENPMPLAVMGLGLAWLMSSSRQSHPASAEPRSFAPSSGGGLGARAHHVGEQAADLVSGAKDRVTEAGASLVESGRSAASGLSSAAGSAMDRAVEYRDRAQRGFSDLLESEPLLIGAVGLVVGAAIGAALPHTDIEDRTVGPLRDKVLEKGKAIADDTLHTASEAAQAAYAGVKDELSNTDGGGDLTERADSAARAAVHAVRDGIQGQS